VLFNIFSFIYSLLFPSKQEKRFLVYWVFRAFFKHLSIHPIRLFNNHLSNTCFQLFSHPWKVFSPFSSLFSSLYYPLPVHNFINSQPLDNGFISPLLEGLSSWMEFFSRVADYKSCIACDTLPSD